MDLKITRAIIDAMIDMGRLKEVSTITKEDIVISNILADKRTVLSDYNEEKEYYEKVTFADKKGNIYHIDLTNRGIQSDINKVIWKDKELKATETNDTWVNTYGRKSLEEETGSFAFYTSDKNCPVIPLYRLIVKITSPEAFRILSSYKQIGGKSLNINHMVTNFIYTGFEWRIYPYADTSQLHPDYLEIISTGQNKIHADISKEYKVFFANPERKRICSYFMVKEASTKIEQQGHADFEWTNNMLDNNFPESIIK